MDGVLRGLSYSNRIGEEEQQFYLFLYIEIRLCRWIFNSELRSIKRFLIRVCMKFDYGFSCGLNWDLALVLWGQIKLLAWEVFTINDNRVWQFLEWFSRRPSDFPAGFAAFCCWYTIFAIPGIWRRVAITLFFWHTSPNFVKGRWNSRCIMDLAI